MESKIKFRAKNTINGNWVYGYFNVVDGIHQISTGHTVYPVHPKTVGQYIGLKDKNDEDIYEGDILKMRMPMPMINGTRMHNVEVFSQGYAFWFKTIHYPGFTDCLWFHYNIGDREKIGNIHENTNLLELKLDLLK